ncbi:MAG: UDP-N-acetylglucosamine 1-carboxyvinyltransferase [Oscillospiraceae bacterium]|nr:UDP-N-acetylglucosamine 1-carboxyvinyltransferase [Oscillospiraceae bacterium]
MKKLMIRGGNVLKGEVTIGGAKNAAVALLPGAMFATSPCIIENVPTISDIEAISAIFTALGAKVEMLTQNTIKIDATTVNSTEVPYELAKAFRASYYFLGALLGKFGKASVAIPGGCDFGERPIDLHLKGFEALGAKVKLEGDVIHLTAEKLTGGHIYFDKVSVGATINIMLAAVMADGVTVMENVAKEPHIVDLANLLNSMGADIRGAGTDVIKVHGVKEMTTTEYATIPDQIEAGTYMVIAAALDGNDVLISNVIPKHLESITQVLKDIGVEVTEYDESIRVKRTGPIKCTSVKTRPHPGFPTDMQAQIVALLSTAEGTSSVTENVWDNRFQYIPELQKMGTDIRVLGKTAVIDGVKQLHGASVKSTDLRAGAAMIIAGLMADGITEVHNIKHIERGYENVVQKLKGIGAEIVKTEA